MSSVSIVTARNITRRYGNFRALDGVSFDINAGSIVGLIGPNGAGKTTLLKAMLGLDRFDGELQVLGRDPRAGRAPLMKDVAFIADVATLPRWIRVHELIAFMRGIHPDFDPRRATKLLLETRIPPKAKVRSLSRGMVVQLHLALIMAIDARFLVLDEPTLGLDILFRKRFYQRLAEDHYRDEALSTSARSVLVTTHNVEEIEGILTHVMFIQDGRIVVDASMDNLAGRYTEVMMPEDNAEAGRALSPISERNVFGRSVFIYDNVDSRRVKALGETRTPGLADLFVALMSEDEKGDHHE